MKIALDYDNTYSVDPDGWDSFATLMEQRGHEVRIVTVRDERKDRTAAMIATEEKFSVIYTRGVAKKWYCLHFGEGFVPDVWIDDKPETIISNSAATVEELAIWREKREDGPHVRDLYVENASILSPAATAEHYEELAEAVKNSGPGPVQRLDAVSPALGGGYGKTDSVSFAPHGGRRPWPPAESRETFVVPEGFEAVRDEEGRATGELRYLENRKPVDEPDIIPPARGPLPEWG